MTKRLLLVAACLWFCAVPARAQAVVQEGVVDGAAYTIGVKTYTGLAALGANGNTVVCGVVNLATRSFSSVTLGTQAMTQLPNTLLANFLAIYYRTLTGTEASAEVVVTLSGNDTSASSMNCVELSGLASDQSGAVGTNENSASATSHDVGPVTPATTNNIVIAFSNRGNRTWVPNAGWDDIGAAGNTYSFVYDIQPAADARTYSFSTAGGAATAQMAISALSGASASGSCCGSGFPRWLSPGGLR